MRKPYSLFFCCLRHFTQRQSSYLRILLVCFFSMDIAGVRITSDVPWPDMLWRSLRIRVWRFTWCRHEFFPDFMHNTIHVKIKPYNADKIQAHDLFIMCLIFTRIRQILCPIGVPCAAFCFAKILLSGNVFSGENTRAAKCKAFLTNKKRLPLQSRFVGGGVAVQTRCKNKLQLSKRSLAIIIFKYIHISTHISPKIY